MQCKIELIDEYPFQLHLQSKLMQLSYTCFIDEETAERLEIQSNAYRYLRSNHANVLVFILVDQHIKPHREIVLKVPYNLLKRFHKKDQLFIHRKPLEMASPFQPKLCIAKEMNAYFNSTFVVDPALIEMITESNFICQNGEYYLDCLWFENRLKKYQSKRASLQWKYNLGESLLGKYKTYLKIYLQVPQNGDVWLFKNGETKLNIKNQDFHPYNIHKSIQLLPIQEMIFQQNAYQILLDSLRQKLNQSSMAILQTQKDIGLQSLLHNYSQNQLDFNYQHINCQMMISTQQFWRYISTLTRLQSSIILITNLQWIQQLYQSQQVNNFTMKEIIKKLEQIFLDVLTRSFRKYCLIIQCIGTNITLDMFQKVFSFSLVLQKPTKAAIFEMIFNQNQRDYASKHQIIDLFHDKFGWQAFKQFMDNNWSRIRSKDKAQIIKQIRSLVKQQQAQNLIQVSWDDVGGLETAKEEIIQTILLPIQHPQIFDEWIRPRTGLLFYGPPGTGKTLLGKCIAKECKMNFISVKGPQLLNMYVGESEKNVRQVFQRAQKCKPCIVFMDQLDALIPKRGNSGDSNQVMDRIVAELLMQMDTASANLVFIIGATNRPDLLDPSILRPGRFDKQIYLGITKTKEDRIKILKAQTRHLALQQGLSWQNLIDQIPQNFTGADFYGLTSKAVMAAAERTIEQYEQGKDHDKIIICESDFLKAVIGIKPSVTQADLARYQQLKKIYS